MTDVNKEEFELGAAEEISTEKAEENTEPKREIVFEEALEAVLFAAGHPISYATLARVFDYTPSAIKNKVLRYAEKYNDASFPRGVILLTSADSCQLCTKQYYLPEIRETLGIKKSGTLSTSSMEALAIVAYNQPVTRVFVDTLRRADSSYAMNNLLDRGLIESKGRLDVPGRPMLYGTTNDFLRSFGLKDLSELPTTTEEIENLFAKGKNVEKEITEEELLEKENSNGVTGQISMEIAMEGADSADPIADEEKIEATLEYEEPSAEDDIVIDG